MKAETLGQIAYCTYRRVTEKNFVTLPWDNLPPKTKQVWIEQAQLSQQTYEEENEKNLESCNKIPSRLSGGNSNDT